MSRLAAFGPFGLAFGVFVLGLVVMVEASEVTTPSFAEAARLEAAERAKAVVLDVAGRGFAALVPSGRGGKTFEPAVLLSAWSSLALGRLGLLDPLTALRAPLLLVAALGPVAAFALSLRSWGTLGALGGALLLALHPGWIHGGVTGSEPVVVATSWLVVLAAHVASLRGKSGRARLSWGAASGIGLGVGLALSLAAAWVVPLLVAHFAVARWSSIRRLVPRGRVPVPVSLLGCALLAFPTFLALTPGLWGARPIAVARTLLSPLDARPLDAPLSVGGWTLATLPAGVVLLLLVGAAVTLRARASRRFATGRLRAPIDRGAVGALSGLGLLATLVAAPLLPDVLSASAPRLASALPFVALLAGAGFGAAAAAVAGGRAGLALAVLVLVPLAVLGTREMGTASVAGAPFHGGANAAGLAVADGSELGAVVAGVADHFPDGATVNSSVVPGDYWKALGRTTGAKLRPVPDPRRAQVVVERGEVARGPIVARSVRGRVTVWTASRPTVATGPATREP